MDAGGPFPGGKARPGRDSDHSPPTSAEVKYELYSLLPSVYMACGGTALLFNPTECVLNTVKKHQNIKYFCVLDVKII
jgi:hypothetical protein